MPRATRAARRARRDRRVARARCVRARRLHRSAGARLRRRRERRRARPNAAPRREPPPSMHRGRARRGTLDDRAVWPTRAVIRQAGEMAAAKDPRIAFVFAMPIERAPLVHKLSLTESEIAG